MIRKMSAMIVLVLAIVTVFFGSARTALAGGPIDTDGFCKHMQYVGFALADTTAWGVRCKDATGHLFSLSMDQACQWQYGGDAKSAYSEFSNWRSWYCVGGNFNLPMSATTVAPALAPTLTPVYVATAPSTDPDIACKHQVVGLWEQGQVTPGLSNNIRSGAGTSFKVTGQLPAGGVFQVVSKAKCADHLLWLHIRSVTGDSSISGWMAQGPSGHTSEN